MPNDLIQETMPVNSTAVVRTVNVLVVHMSPPSIDDVIGLMKCFPCLQKLYVKVTNVSHQSFVFLFPTALFHLYHPVYSCFQLLFSIYIIL